MLSTFAFFCWLKAYDDMFYIESLKSSLPKCYFYLFRMLTSMFTIKVIARPQDFLSKHGLVHRLIWIWYEFFFFYPLGNFQLKSS